MVGRVMATADKWFSYIGDRRFWEKIGKSQWRVMASRRSDMYSTNDRLTSKSNDEMGVFTMDADSGLTLSMLNQLM